MSAKKLSTDQNELNSVLIISQDIDMARVWKMLFEKRNCHVIHEMTPREGLQTSLLLTPALVVLDMEMPKEEKLDLCSRLRTTTNGTLLLVTSELNNINVVEYQNAGVDETIPDNINPVALLIKSLAWLARQDWLIPRRQTAEMTV